MIAGCLRITISKTTIMLCDLSFKGSHLKKNVWFNPNWNKNHSSQGLAPALHLRLDLHAIQLGGCAISLNAIFGPQVLVFGGKCCPGPGSSWGNLAAPPASKDAKSPSMSFHSPPNPHPGCLNHYYEKRLNLDWVWCCGLGY